MDDFEIKQQREKETRALVEQAVDRMFNECKLDESIRKGFSLGCTTGIAAMLFLDLSEERQKHWMYFFNKEQKA